MNPHRGGHSSAVRRGGPIPQVCLLDSPPPDREAARLPVSPNRCRAGRAARACLRAALLTLVTLPASLPAQDRLVRRFGGETGLVPSVMAMAQDSTGFLWAGTRAGLFRYDGTRFQRWAPEVLPRAVGSLAVSPEGTVVAVDAEGLLFEVTGDGARRVSGAARRSPGHSQIAAFDPDGRLWVVTLDGDVAWREDETRWHTVPPGAFQGDTARKVFGGGPRGGVLVAGSTGLWGVVPGAESERLLDAYRLVDVLALPDGRILALSASADVILLDGGAPPEIVSPGASVPPTRGISLAERDGTVWVATDRYLIAFGPEGLAEVLGPDQDVAAGGPALVDHEGSLWHAGFTALSQYPEPGTQVWDERHGLPSAHTRFLGRSGGVTWVATWQGTGYVRLVEGRWRAGVHPAVQASAQVCPDGEGGLVLGTPRGIARVRGMETRIVNAGAAGGFSACAPASAGGYWVGTFDGLHHLSGDGASFVPIPSFPHHGRQVHVILEDRAGRVWAGSEERICRAPSRRLSSGGSAEWTCETLPRGLVHLNAIVELASGTIWAASSTMGVFRHMEGRWELLADNETLPTRSVLNLVASPRGGVWLVGIGILRRVAERADGSGWSVLEELGPWHGVPSVGGGDLLEEEGGTIWIATAMGVIRVPADVRSVEPLPPRMALVEARVDGEPVPLDRAVVLPADRNRLELRFAALTFRDPGRVRYQVRLSAEEAWADTEGRPFFHWVDLPAGPHRPQVRASLDGDAWSVQPAELAFRVLPPWYRTRAAMGLFVLLGGGLLFGVYRARLAYLLGLERQRTRIAMDLHDEMGSGLASIGILGRVLSHETEAAKRDPGIAREVAATAEELSNALSDIVWSLDPRSATLDELAARLAEHGDRLFADDVQFDADLPDEWPPSPLPLPVLRSVLLIGLEALHNVARHADADRVLLSLAPKGAGWVLTLSDDGRGLPAFRSGNGQEDRRSNGAPGGRGLRGMRRRAAEIGGAITWEPRPGGGTTMRLEFELRPRGQRLLRWLTGWKRRPRPASWMADSHEDASALPGKRAHR